jgi:D-alanyl-D-alanine carboxypeptidase/D-alanyl-D-alanine-endopeptidase (penicillin-binding protein 4)
MRRALPFSVTAFAVLSSVMAYPAAAQGSLARRLERLADQPPLDRAAWGVLIADAEGRTVYARNADRLFVPASNAKLIVAAAASALLPQDYRAVTSVYGTGPLEDGVLHGDLVIFGRGDPTFSARCYGADTLAAGACDSMWTRLDLLADRIVARGVRHVTGAIIGDGSYFEPILVHPAWEGYDVNWWYAAPVSALGFNDNSVDVQWAPGPSVDAPAAITLTPDVGLLSFENRTRTVPAGGERTIDFFREPGTTHVWAEGTVPLSRSPRTEYFAVPDPNRYFAAALRSRLALKGVSVAGPTRSTTDSLTYAWTRETPALAEVRSRPLADMIFPILNSSQNWFAEMLLKAVGKTAAGDGSWDGGLEAERRFLEDSVGIDSTAFALSDGSGLSSGNLITPRALVQLLTYMRGHPRGQGFHSALPRSGSAGSLRQRFVGTPLEGLVAAKTGSIYHVNSLSGYVERPDRLPLVFSVIVNNHTARSSEIVARIDSMVVAAAR